MLTERRVLGRRQRKAYPACQEASEDARVPVAKVRGGPGTRRARYREGMRREGTRRARYPAGPVRRVRVLAGAPHRTFEPTLRQARPPRVFGNHGGRPQDAVRTLALLQGGLTPAPTFEPSTRRGNNRRSGNLQCTYLQPCGAPPCRRSAPLGPSPGFEPALRHCIERGQTPIYARRSWDLPRVRDPRFGNSCPLLGPSPGSEPALRQQLPLRTSGAGRSAGVRPPCSTRGFTPRPEVCPRDTCTGGGGLAYRNAGSNVLRGAPARTLTRLLARRVLARRVPAPGTRPAGTTCPAGYPAGSPDRRP